MRGITKEEIQDILDKPDIKIEGLAEAIEKIVARNNELMCISEAVKIDNMKDEIREVHCKNCDYGIKFNAKYNDSWYVKPTNQRTKVNIGEVVCSEPIVIGKSEYSDGRKVEYDTIIRCPHCNKLNKVTFSE